MENLIRLPKGVCVTRHKLSPPTNPPSHSRPPLTLPHSSPAPSHPLLFSVRRSNLLVCTFLFCTCSRSFGTWPTRPGRQMEVNSLVVNRACEVGVNWCLDTLEQSGCCGRPDVLNAIYIPPLPRQIITSTPPQLHALIPVQAHITELEFRFLCSDSGGALHETEQIVSNMLLSGNNQTGSVWLGMCFWLLKNIMWPQLHFCFQFF